MISRRSFRGQAASFGIALGLSYRVDIPPAAVDAPPQLLGDPVERVVAAFDAVAAQLLGLAETLRRSGQPDLADIVEVNGYIAKDRELRENALRRIRDDDAHAAHAVAQAVYEYAEAIGSLNDATLAERATDVRQVGRRVLAQLSGSFSAAPDGPLVLCAREIGAADLLERGDMVVAAVSMLGGPNGHASIIARSLGIPLLLGVDRELLEAPDGTEILVDTARSRATVHPAVDERADAIAAMNGARRRREALALERGLPCRTLDGHPIGLRANVATAAETRAARAYNAGGVGLLRTEMPFLDAYGWPSEFQHEAVLTPIISKLTGQPVTVRTLDFADDKLPPFLRDRHEGDRLGRGLALMLAESAAFVHQFRAILSVSLDVDLRIMIPMVADVAELRACKKILAECAAELGVPLPPIGAMIELPEAVSAADELAREAAFISIGSNDLTSRILELDRRDPALTPALAAHPRVLRAIAHTVDAAHRHDREVSVCGDAAAHPLVVPLLIGVNCDALSVAPAALDEVRARVRRLNRDLCAEAAWQAQRCHFFDDVMRIVEERCSPDVP